jgi:hypothetical protein
MASDRSVAAITHLRGYYDDGRLRYWEDAGFMTGPPLERNWRAPYDKGFTVECLF